ncbi:DNA repair protein RecN [Xylanimonas cellulosilytica DSM 15894]|uniref:DNA repair protein RecN n=1 Tax=Xylanimonas cellulosilytica (strain DSM 15894 / JCM 12276 / CECT 5975 / KCTC 9989 / LMG 20990 / NBRC 107835 / XIL07) TaxID=446471 RepID=D1BRB8_XYLCX|nr:DNA repair protein RecN [Xylanimonas cellulosilytica]ACZ30373.1 DNA repair protein RecN [Xylanimonas cellulosilytica DSM 15894]
MLEEIAIENLGVIRAARVSLARGLTVITGETGAGKTMVLTGLGLLMGGKADPGAVRPGAKGAAVEGRWQLAARPAVVARVEDAGGTVDDDGSVVVLRTVAAEGRSRAHLGGRSVPQGVLAEIADELVTVHGQADQLRLRTPSKQREALDAFAGGPHQATLEAYRAAWAERGALQAEIDDLAARTAERAREAELLRLGLAEIERVDPQPGEDAELQTLVARLGNVEALRVGATEAHEALAGEDLGEVTSAVELLTRARRALEAAAHDDATLGGLATRVAEAGYLVSDVATELSAYVDDLQADPAALERAHARLAELTALTRTYGETVDDVLRWASDAGLRLLDLDDGGERMRGLTQRVAELDDDLARLGGEVTVGRSGAGERLAAAVTDELKGLAMGGARLEVEVAAAEPGPWGADQVTFSLVPHPGAPARPLGKGASGGELSRVMLAVEVSLATAVVEASEGDGGAAVLPTFVFDEVDAGVGGRAAVEVGRRLAQLARSTQVIVVTHLAQVAAFADAHLVVTKSAGDAGTVTGVEEVRDDDRVRELARMLSGQEDSDAARTHAVELLSTSVVGR